MEAVVSKVIDTRKIEEIVESIQSKGSCENNDCLHCRIQQEIHDIRCLDNIYYTVFLYSLTADPIDSISLAFAQGFCLAYDYMENKKLEELMKGEKNVTPNGV